VSGVLVVLALVGIFGRDIQLGLEFQGGRLVEFATTQPVDVEELRISLAEEGIARALVQESGQGTVVIRTGQLDAQQEEALEATVANLGGDITLIRDQFVGPTLGVELRNRALMALGLALLVQLAYLAFRFRWTVGLASMTALFHDVVILIGIFAWMGKTFDGVFLAALLTVIGYSVNDSVVIFDRVRESYSNQPDRPMSELANEASLQTLPRTINTGMGALLILFALFVLGGDTLSDFALALLIGTVVGSYSSIFTATPVMLSLEERFPRPLPEPEKPAARRARERERERR
jgi:SecD/SecF fusion protein